MNPGDTTSEIHLGTGAMALDCLPFDEAIEFTDHLSTCESCAAELVGFLETAAILGSAAAVTPPASLRTAVLDAIRVTPQLPPLVTGNEGPAALGRHRTTDPGESAATDNVIPLRRAWYRRPQAFLAAAVAVVIIAVGAFVFTRSSSSGPSQAETGSCASTASDVRTVAPVSGAQGDVLYSASCREATVTPAGLQALPAGQVYQLWAIKGTDAAHARSLALLTDNTGGGLKPTSVQFQSGENTVAISVEPTGGSKEPTTTPVWTASLIA